MFVTMRQSKEYLLPVHRLQCVFSKPISHKLLNGKGQSTKIGTFHFYRESMTNWTQIMSDLPTTLSVLTCLA